MRAREFGMRKRGWDCVNDLVLFCIDGYGNMDGNGHGGLGGLARARYVPG